MNKHDELSAAIMRATTISNLAGIDDEIVVALMRNEINCTQAALLRRSVQRREDAIATLATA
jgi:hypothetical protein